MIAARETVIGRSSFMLNDLERQVREFGTQGIFHFGRPLTAHLIDTAKWLDKWGASSTLVRAGAFHSIYGTEEFREKAVSLDQRPKFQQIIGQDAEALVYLFCMANRHTFIDGQVSAPYRIALPSLGTDVEIDDPTFTALLEIEAANIVDGALHQPDAPPAAGPFWLARFESVKSKLSIQAYSTARDVLTNWTADAVRDRMRAEGWLTTDRG